MSKCVLIREIFNLAHKILVRKPYERDKLEGQRNITLKWILGEQGL